VFIHCSPGGTNAFVCRLDLAEHYHQPVSGTEVAGPSWGADTVTKFLAKIVAWITAGYPEGVPGPDRVPLLALLKPRLTDDEVKAVARELLERGEFDQVDIGVLITQITDELPQPEDIERVRNRLAAKGWPLDDARDAEETE
jgi:Protein of unknown function (DUF3349)